MVDQIENIIFGVSPLIMVSGQMKGSNFKSSIFLAAK